MPSWHSSACRLSGKLLLYFGGRSKLVSLIPIIKLVCCSAVSFSSAIYGMKRFWYSPLSLCHANNSIWTVIEMCSLIVDIEWIPLTQFRFFFQDVSELKFVFIDHWLLTFLKLKTNAVIKKNKFDITCLRCWSVYEFSLSFHSLLSIHFPSAFL